MSTLATLALATGVVCALAPLAQAARIGATGSAHDVSLIWLCLYAAGSVVWVTYGAAIGSLPLILSQSTALVSVGVALVLARRYRRPGPPSGGKPPGGTTANVSADLSELSDNGHPASRQPAAGGP